VELYRLLIRHGAAWLDEMPAAALAQLAVDGSDVARTLGREPGPWLGNLLGRLLEDVALGDVANERDRLLERARTYGENL
jgi:tRNA nucleotidyltransferase (CCA-adding enzyme)